MLEMVVMEEKEDVEKARARFEGGFNSDEVVSMNNHCNSMDINFTFTQPGGILVHPLATSSFQSLSLHKTRSTTKPPRLIPHEILRKAISVPTSNKPTSASPLSSIKTRLPFPDSPKLRSQPSSPHTTHPSLLDSLPDVVVIKNTFRTRTISSVSETVIVKGEEDIEETKVRM
ncbi:hypothetical protein V5O48_019137 [Marasmius crinis-equi]|uniref:Uncharacterized protein n=1 Tax=Marasmius crinis-equi TaxID=585013 RepID=A0ABR3EJ72_9AGAR